MNDDIRIGLAEALGTAVLVIGGAGTAIFATGTFAEGQSVGILGVALAFGFSLLAMAYLIGRVSGCHINPAVTIGMIVTRKLDAAKSWPYFVGQFVGGIHGAGLIAASPRTATVSTRPRASTSSRWPSSRSSSPPCSC
jgi:aquaporin Z